MGGFELVNYCFIFWMIIWKECEYPEGREGVFEYADSRFKAGSKRTLRETRRRKEWDKLTQEW